MRFPSPSAVFRALLHWGLVTLLLLLTLLTTGGAILHWRSWSYQQLDDAEPLAAKRQYLATVAETGIGSAGSKPPNIVLILFDDMGFGDIGAYGASAIRTPQLDALAAGGVRLTDYYAPAPLMLQMPVGPWLFDLQFDSDESYDVSDRQPEVMERLGTLLRRRVEQDGLDPRGFASVSPRSLP